jgi:hypothetical protein
MGGRILFTKESFGIIVGLMGLILFNIDRTSLYGLETLIGLEDMPRGHYWHPRHFISKNRQKKAFKPSRKHPWADSSDPWHFALGDDQRSRVFSMRETIAD